MPKPTTKRRTRRTADHGPHEPWPAQRRRLNLARRRPAQSLIHGRGYRPSDGSRTFLVSMLVELPGEQDHADVEDAFTCMPLDTLGEEVGILAVTAREVRALRP
jgi:hypothetical protein